jgi:hypothetical protein
LSILETKKNLICDNFSPENPGTILNQNPVIYRETDFPSQHLSQLPPPNKRKKSAKSPGQLSSATAVPPAVKVSSTSSAPLPQFTTKTYKNSRLRAGSSQAGDKSSNHVVAADRPPRSSSIRPEVVSTTSRNDGQQWEWTFANHEPADENVDFVVERRRNKPAKRKGAAAGAGGEKVAGKKTKSETIGLRKEEEMKTTLSPEAWLNRQARK